MNIWEIVKTVGPRILDVALPGAGVALQAVNAFLPDDKKLPATATGEQLGAAMQSLTPEQQATLAEKQFDVEIVEIQESHSTVRAMLESDAANPHTTRPYIAKQAFHVIAFSIIATTAMWSYAVLIENDTMVKTIMDGWVFVVGVNGTLATLLLAYFGVLRKEHKQKMDAANGAAPQTGLAGIISAIAGRGK